MSTLFYAHDRGSGFATERIETACGHLYVTVNIDPKTNLPLELLVRVEQANACMRAQTEAISNLISLALSHKIPLKKIIKQLDGISCNAVDSERSAHEQPRSCCNTLVQVLKKYLKGECAHGKNYNR